MRRNLRPAFLALTTVSVLMSESALAFWCDGQVSSIAMDSARLYVSYGSIPLHVICSLGSSAADYCRPWQATLLAAQAQQRTVRLYYYENVNGNPTSCGQLAEWGVYSPYFVQIIP